MVARRKIRKPVRSADTPATSGMLFEMEGRLAAQIGSVKSELKKDFHALKGEFHGLKGEFHGLKSEIQGMKAELHRVALLVEEQNARNNYVLDGYAQIYDLIDKRRKS